MALNPMGENGEEQRAWTMVLVNTVGKDNYDILNSVEWIANMPEVLKLNAWDVSQVVEQIHKAFEYGYGAMEVYAQLAI